MGPRPSIEVCGQDWALLENDGGGQEYNQSCSISGLAPVLSDSSWVLCLLGLIPCATALGLQRLLAITKTTHTATCVTSMGTWSAKVRRRLCRYSLVPIAPFSHCNCLPLLLSVPSRIELLDVFNVLFRSEEDGTSTVDARRDNIQDPLVTSRSLSTSLPISVHPLYPT